MVGGIRTTDLADRSPCCLLEQHEDAFADIALRYVVGSRSTSSPTAAHKYESYHNKYSPNKLSSERLLAKKNPAAKYRN